jgi:soluble lytic murein transglycosylase-like protein
VRWAARGLWALLGRIRRAYLRLMQRLSKKARLRVHLAAAALLLTAPVWMINVAVSFFGNSAVFPLSPYFLREKLSALGSYATHRPFCLITGHPETAPLVARAEARHHLPRGLLAAVIQVESAGRPHRISGAGAMGPGQLMPSTARSLGVGDPFDSADNIDGAARLLARHLAHFRKVRLAVAAYNAGPGAVNGGVPNNGETPQYVARVMRVYESLRPRRATAGPGARPGRSERN